MSAGPTTPEAAGASPSTTSVADITGSFCCHVHLLAGRDAVAQWRGRHAGGTALSVQDAFELGRIVTRCD